MPKRRLIWQLFPLFVLVSFGSLVVAGVYAAHTFRTLYRDRYAADLEARGRLVEELLGAKMFEADRSELQSLCAEIGRKSSTRITLILESGEVVADSEHDAGAMENHASRPEVAQALRGETGRSTRMSATLRRPMSYVAIPINRNGRTAGVVRVAAPEFSLVGSMGGIYTQLGAGVLFITVLVALLSLAASRRITIPIQEIREGAERLAGGDMASRLRMPDSEELGQLAETMNTMAGQLDDRIQTVERQRNELEAVLSSMVEGVLAVDTKECVISLNSAAADMFDVPKDRAIGRVLYEVIRNSELQRFVTGMLAGTGPREADLVLLSGGERSLRLHGAPLTDASGKNIGCVVVLHDVTRLIRLENARRDFVANVSHELKTPITSIKGYVETLQDGAIHDPDSSRRFLSIIAKQADRLHALVEDLLKLSRLEQEVEKEEIVLTEGPVDELIDLAVQACEVSARAKNITIKRVCEPGLVARMNLPLAQTALENLMDNAIKYSDEGTEVQVAAASENGSIAISVRDQGVGIEKQHLDRIFERFYRVDKARSRKLGGTGLGLAIVKHIVRVHGGHTTVESAPGKGSTFTIHLPRRLDASERRASA